MTQELRNNQIKRIFLRVRLHSQMMPSFSSSFNINNEVHRKKERDYV